MLGNSTTGYEGWLSWWEELNRAQTLSKERTMSNQPVGNTNGIFSLFFREVGLFWEQAFRWANEQAKEDRLLTLEEDRRRVAEAEARRAEAEARLLEQARLARQAGVDVDALLKEFRRQ